MARKNATRKIHQLSLPRGVDRMTIQTAVENDPVFQDQVRLSMRRVAQRKITEDQFRHIHRDLLHRAVYRHARAIKVPAIMVTKMEAMLAA